MNRFHLQLWAGALVTLLAITAGIPVLAMHLTGQDPTIGPPWLWWNVFAWYLVTFAATTWLVEVVRRWWMLALMAAQATFGAATVLLAPTSGWTPILLVLTAALSTYVVPRRWTAAIVGANTMVAGAAVWIGGGSPTEIVMSACIYLILQALSVVAIVIQQREETSRRELAVAHAELRAASALLEDSSRGAERLRIARDLHDVVGHQLTALALELEVASHHSSPPTSDHVGRARGIAKDLLADVRSAVGALRRERLEIRSTLEAIVTDLPEPTVHLDIDDEVEVDDGSAITLVRCVQEIVTNTIRHADAENLWIDLRSEADGGTVLTARDDGKGAKELRVGNGLRGLRERVEELGGEVTFRGDRGFEVVAEMPAT
jgi:signal transduction histidine kinase